VVLLYNRSTYENDAMKIALVVNLVVGDLDKNLTNILSKSHEAVNEGAEIILFPEAALTGLINNDDPEHDSLIAQTIPGSFSLELSSFCSSYKIYIGIGILEREGNKIFDSAILIDPKGDTILKYKRIDSHWHGAKADSQVYCEGVSLEKRETEFGALSFLLCGDLFNNDVVEMTKSIKPDYVLAPFARCFDDFSIDQERWDREEKYEYVKRVKNIGITSCMTNYFADKSLNGGSFGGALVVSKDGFIIDELPLGKEGILVVDIE
jgi:predicted amidohydrolase